MVNPLQCNTEEELEDLLSEPSEADVELARQLGGDIAVLGAGGKMGPTLVRRIARALARAESSCRVYAVSRFSQPGLSQKLQAEGATTIAMDLLEPQDWQHLPATDSVIYMVGSKFGTESQPSRTWAINTYLPGRVLEHYQNSKMVVLSTGNVYPLVDVASRGCREDHTPGPIGEYAQSCLGRERIVEHFSKKNSTPVCLLRLNYAVETRYGVLVDIARKVWEGRPVALDMGFVNVIWQGDANSASFRSLALCTCPPRVLNLTGNQTLSVRELSVDLGKRLGREPKFTGRESPTALLSDARQSELLLGAPRTSVSMMLDIISAWVRRGGRMLDKPTHFEVRDGRF